MERNSQKNSLLIKKSIKSDQNYLFPVQDEITFKDIAKYLELPMQDSIKRKLEEIDDEVENLGKVCDNLYKKSSEEYKTILNKEREDLDKSVKKYIFDLKGNLMGFKERINYDYKGKFLSINDELTNISNKIDSGTKQYIKLKNKMDCLIEDSTFLSKQLEDIKDMNIYLKYKLKLFLGDISEEINSSEKKEKTKDTLIEENNKLNNNNLSNNNNSKENKKEEKKEINMNDKKEKEDKNNVYQDKLYLTATKNFKNSTNRKRYLKYNGFDEVEYLNSKLNLEETRLINYIQHEKEKNIKLNQIYNNLYLKNQNPNFNNLKNLIDEYNAINKSKISEMNNINESSFNNNKSNFQSNFSTSLSNSVSLGSKKYYTPENPGYGYMDRKENKEIMLNFLENIETKKIIYKLMYGD